MENVFLKAIASVVLRVSRKLVLANKKALILQKKIAKGLRGNYLAILIVVPLGLKVWYLVFLNDILILL